MDKIDAVAGLAALGQGARLDVFRVLVQAGDEGLAVGEIARRFKLPGATLSFHLKQLKGAGLVTVRRQGTSLIYAAASAGMDELLGYLIENCCPGGLSRGAGVDCAPVRPAADVVIYHHPSCGRSRNVLAMIHNTGIEPHVIDVVKTPPTRALLVQLIQRAGLTPREALRKLGTPYAELGLGDLSLTDQQLVDAMIAQPILVDRPFMVTRLGVRLCRPSEIVLDILPLPQLHAFTKEHGERVVDADGERVRWDRL